jgi:predicted transcriptional regulator
MAQSQILKLLRKDTWMNAASLSRQMGVNRSTVNTNLKRMRKFSRCFGITYKQSKNRGEYWFKKL